MPKSGNGFVKKLGALVCLFVCLLACFLKRQKKKACGWIYGEMGRVWEEMGVWESDQNILCDKISVTKGKIGYPNDSILSRKTISFPCRSWQQTFKRHGQETWLWRLKEMLCFNVWEQSCWVILLEIPVTSASSSLRQELLLDCLLPPVSSQ